MLVPFTLIIMLAAMILLFVTKKRIFANLIVGATFAFSLLSGIKPFFDTPDISRWIDYRNANPDLQSALTMLGIGLFFSLIAWYATKNMPELE